ncbi:hypothetical protein ROTAS13_04424 [Roseomonas sp. TAS13]|nr:hypothetical protein ROTAS13_04424 [Roseomonas sp. TAS13]
MLSSTSRQWARRPSRNSTRLPVCRAASASGASLSQRDSITSPRDRSPVKREVPVTTSKARGSSLRISSMGGSRRRDAIPSSPNARTVSRSPRASSGAAARSAGCASASSTRAWSTVQTDPAAAGGDCAGGRGVPPAGGTGPDTKASDGVREGRTTPSRVTSRIIRCRRKCSRRLHSACGWKRLIAVQDKAALRVPHPQYATFGGVLLNSHNGKFQAAAGTTTGRRPIIASTSTSAASRSASQPSVPAGRSGRTIQR